MNAGTLYEIRLTTIVVVMVLLLYVMYTERSK